MHKEIPKLHKEVPFDRPEHPHKLLLLHNQAVELLVGPVVGVLQRACEVLQLHVFGEVALQLVAARVFDALAAFADDVEVFACH